LNSNAGAMQAVASFLSVAVTLVLVIITARYVRLTKGLAEAANVEGIRQNEASKARKRDLASQIKFLRDAVATLPNATNWSHADALMRNSTGWENFDFGAFRRLAAEISDAASSGAASVETNMRWMADHVKAVKKTPLRMGYDWNSFPQREWNNAMHDAPEALASILAELSAKP
jgi:hypothetical protein